MSGDGDHLQRAIKRLPVAFPPRMTSYANYSFFCCAIRFGDPAISAMVRHLNKGGTAVDLSLRLNVLAVCAVFAFVGAILLGAF